MNKYAYSPARPRRAPSAGGVWLTLVLILVLVLASSLLLYTMVGGFSNKDMNTVKIVPSGDAASSGDSGTQAGQMETRLNLFKNVYYNTKGEMVVESNNGDAVIAPGTAGKYRFSLSNPGNISMDFNMRLLGTFTISQLDIPMELRLRCSREWVVGGDEQWISVAALRDTDIKGTIPAGGSLDYQIEWRWEYENGDPLGDISDTLLGDVSSLEGKENDSVFDLKVVTTAVNTPGAVPVNDKGLTLLTALIPTWILYPLLIAIIALSVVGLSTVAVVKKIRSGSGWQ